MRIGLLQTGLASMLMLGVARISAAPAGTGGLPPWRFGMTPGEVTSFADYGPYRAFSNGDLETYAGLFSGRKENVQFFFKGGKLARIGIYLYEGQDIDAATLAWSEAYAVLRDKFGSIELPDLQVRPVDGKIAPEAIASAVVKRVRETGKTQMAPVGQPVDKFVFASFGSAEVQGHVFYYVTVYYDPPHG